MSSICRALGISRSGFYQRLFVSAAKPLEALRPSDKVLLNCIEDVLRQRPSYGYRRVTAVLKRQLKGVRINHKRVYRIMKAHNLLLIGSVPRPTRTHNGKIVTAASDMRWCSDVFSVLCDNDERVQVAFCLDCHDREVLSWAVSTRGVGGQLMRDMMLKAVEARCGGRLPRRVQWLSDNGPCYTARETVRFGRQLGFEMCTTSPYSPQSNGMAEAFVKTFKRDYVFSGANLSSAKAFIQQLPEHFRDYNEFAPHKGLGMMAPREYRQKQLAN